MVLPNAERRIDDGAVLIKRHNILKVGRWRDLSTAAAHSRLDLGEVILLPGLINAHCHLDYTDMAGQLPPQKSFVDWIKLIKETKDGWSLEDYRQSWLNGARMLLRTGTTAVGDVEAVHELLPGVWRETPLRVISFLEMIELSEERADERVSKAARIAKRLSRDDKHSVGLSPHAPYSTTPELLRQIARVAELNGWRVMTHVGESALEYEMFSRQRGELYKWLARSGRPMRDCGTGSPVKQVLRAGLTGQKVVLVHANYLGRGDVQELVRHEVHVVHCPRSHIYFGHAEFPLKRLMRARGKIALGTDSLASVLISRGQTAQLSMFAEMRALHRAHPWTTPKGLLKMATRNSAEALGLQDAGELREGYQADLIAVPFSWSEKKAYDAVLYHRGPVHCSMIGGQWAMEPETPVDLP